jgi:hypothetical protein
VPHKNRINVTGKNALVALLIAFIITIVVTIIYSLMALFFYFEGNNNISIAGVTDYLRKASVQTLKQIGLCTLPVGFLLSFALLQRFRVKD